MRPSIYLFPGNSRNGTISTSISWDGDSARRDLSALACTALGLEKEEFRFTWHSPRHSILGEAAENLFVSTAAAAEWGGWHQVKDLKGYGHEDPARQLLYARAITGETVQKPVRVASYKQELEGPSGSRLHLHVPRLQQLFQFCADVIALHQGQYPTLANELLANTTQENIKLFSSVLPLYAPANFAVAVDPVLPEHPLAPLPPQQLQTFQHGMDPLEVFKQPLQGGGSSSEACASVATIAAPMSPTSRALTQSAQAMGVTMGAAASTLYNAAHRNIIGGNFTPTTTARLAGVLAGAATQAAGGVFPELLRTSHAAAASAAAPGAESPAFSGAVNVPLPSAIGSWGGFILLWYGHNPSYPPLINFRVPAAHWNWSSHQSKQRYCHHACFVAEILRRMEDRERAAVRQQPESPIAVQALRRVESELDKQFPAAQFSNWDSKYRILAKKQKQRGMEEENGEAGAEVDIGDTADPTDADIERAEWQRLLRVEAQVRPVTSSHKRVKFSRVGGESASVRVSSGEEREGGEEESAERAEVEETQELKEEDDGEGGGSGDEVAAGDDGGDLPEPDCFAELGLYSMGTSRCIMDNCISLCRLHPHTEESYVLCDAHLQQCGAPDCDAVAFASMYKRRKEGENGAVKRLLVSQRKQERHWSSQKIRTHSTGVKVPVCVRHHRDKNALLLKVERKKRGRND